MKLYEDDYIRTKDGIIDKVIIEYNGECNSPNCNRKHVSCEHNYYDEDTIIKSSPNIIDLIEIGDIIITKHPAIEKEYIEPINDETTLELLKKCFEEKSLKLISILTKEQFEQMKYKIN